MRVTRGIRVRAGRGRLRSKQGLPVQHKHNIGSFPRPKTTINTLCISLAMLSDAGIAERVKLGLITADSHREDNRDQRGGMGKNIDENDDPNIISSDYRDSSDEECVWDDR